MAACAERQSVNTWKGNIPQGVYYKSIYLDCPPIGAKADVKGEGVHTIPPFGSKKVASNVCTINAGGPVWAMDWLHCARVEKQNNILAGESGLAKQHRQNTTGTNMNGQEQNQPTWRYLALATQPPCTVAKDGTVVKESPPDHYFDRQECGRNLIQIWAVPTIAEGSTVDPTPHLVYAIDHNSGGVWDLQWKPTNRQCPDGCLGTLAAVFNDGTIQVFNVPLSGEPLQNPDSTIPGDAAVVEALQPILKGYIPEAVQLCVQWNPLLPHLLLSGASDGSILLWNIDQLDTAAYGSVDIEPQCRFQDADVASKKKLFEWQWSWVAVRAVAWNPFDAHIFASTGQDHTVKVWDVREPRLSLRSNRTKEPWGLSLKWITPLSLELTADQGFVYVFDAMTGKTQQLHMHPQADSPVWGLDVVRRSQDNSYVVSCCAAGSLRVSPDRPPYRVKKGIRNSIELARLCHFPSLTQDKRSISLGLILELSKSKNDETNTFVDAGGKKIFPTREAALHRVKSSAGYIAGEFWQGQVIAAGGHAGLVMLMHVDDRIDQYVEMNTLDRPPKRKLGRPRKHALQMDQVPQADVKSEPKSRPRRAKKAVQRISDLVDENMVEDVEVEGKKSDSEPEFQEESEEEPDADIEAEMEKMLAQSSEDEKVPSSEEEEEEEEEAVQEVPPVHEEPAENAIFASYQMDISEEEALRLAIQMSKKDTNASNKSNSTPAAPAKKKGRPKGSKNKEKTPSAPPNPTVKKRGRPKGSKNKPKDPIAPASTTKKPRKPRGAKTKPVDAAASIERFIVKSEAPKEAEAPPELSVDQAEIPKGSETPTEPIGEKPARPVGSINKPKQSKAAPELSTISPQVPKELETPTAPVTKSARSRWSKSKQVESKAALGPPTVESEMPKNPETVAEPPVEKPDTPMDLGAPVYQPVKKPGRPRRAQTKPKDVELPSEPPKEKLQAPTELETLVKPSTEAPEAPKGPKGPAAPVVKKRGRPKGSKNKPKVGQVSGPLPPAKKQRTNEEENSVEVKQEKVAKATREFPKEEPMGTRLPRRAKAVQNYAFIDI